MYKEHKFKIVKHAIKNIWLLIFPVLRAVRSYSLDFDAFYNWITGVWFDILVIMFMILFGYFRWLFTHYRLGRHHIRLSTGVFIKTETSIAYDRISSVTTEHSFWLRPFKAAKIRIKTRAKTFGSGDMSIIVHNSDLAPLYKKLTQIRSKKSRENSYELRPKWYAMLFYSVAFSSSLSGIIYLGALLFNTGRMVSENAKQNMNDVYKIANDVSENVADKIPMGIPPIIMVLLLILAATWAFSFLSNMLRYFGFSVKIKKGRAPLRIRTGILTKRIFHINTDKINYIDIRQNFLMKIFRVGSLNINCSGYGASKFEHPVIMPMMKLSDINSLLGHLETGKHIQEREIKPEKMAFWSYISIPFYLLALMLTADFIIAKISPDIAHIIMFIAIMEIIPMVWFMIVKSAAFFSTGVTFKDNYCCVRWSRFLVFHTLLVDMDKTVKMQVFQDVIDEKWDRARLDLYFTSEKPKANKIKGLNIKDAKTIIKAFEKAAKK